MKLSDVTMHNLSEVPADQAFEWVKTGAWNKVTFIQWVAAVKDDVKEHSYSEGYSEGLADERYASENY